MCSRYLFGGLIIDHRDLWFCGHRGFSRLFSSSPKGDVLFVYDGS